MIPRSLALLALPPLWAVVLAAPAAGQDFVLGDYVQLEPGDEWIFEKNGTESSTETVLPGTETIGSVLTTRFREVDSDDDCPDGEISNLTLDGAGLWRYRTVDLCDQDTFDFTSTPFPELPPTATYDVPIPFMGTGTFDFIDSMAGPQSVALTWTNELTVRAPEPVSTPLQVFQAVRVDSIQELTGSLGGQPLVIAIDASDWYAAGVGPVRRTSMRTVTLNGSIIDGESETNLLVPEPTTVGGAAAVLAAAAMLSCARRQIQSVFDRRRSARLPFSRCKSTSATANGMRRGGFWRCS